MGFGFKVEAGKFFPLTEVVLGVALGVGVVVACNFAADVLVASFRLEVVTIGVGLDFLTVRLEHVFEFEDGKLAFGNNTELAKRGECLTGRKQTSSIISI